MALEDIGTVEVTEDCVCWTVPGFADISESHYSSPEFSLGAVGGGVMGYMEMWPNGARPEDEGHVGFDLWCCGGGSVYLPILRYQVSLLTDGRLTHTSQPTPGTRTLLRLIQRAKVLNECGLLQNGQLKVHVKFWDEDTAEPVCPHSTQQNRQSGPSDNLLASATQNLADMSVGGSQHPTDDPRSFFFKRWYQDTNCTDLTVKVQGNEYRAHKFVLASRSRVWYTTFRQDMSECNTDSLDVTDMTSEGFEHLLEYMYTGNVADMSDFAAELLHAAEKYELVELKAMCVASLQNTISAESALDVLSLADLYRAPHLKTTALEFIKRQVTSLTTSDKWINFSRENPQLVAEVVRYLASQLN